MVVSVKNNTRRISVMIVTGAVRILQEKKEKEKASIFVFPEQWLICQP